MHPLHPGVDLVLCGELGLAFFLHVPVLTLGPRVRGARTPAVLALGRGPRGWTGPGLPHRRRHGGLGRAGCRGGLLSQGRTAPGGRRGLDGRGEWGQSGVRSTVGRGWGGRGGLARR